MPLRRRGPPWKQSDTVVVRGPMVRRRRSSRERTLHRREAGRRIHAGPGSRPPCRRGCRRPTMPPGSRRCSSSTPRTPWPSLRRPTCLCAWRLRVAMRWSFRRRWSSMGPRRPRRGGHRDGGRGVKHRAGGAFTAAADEESVLSRPVRAPWRHRRVLCRCWSASRRSIPDRSIRVLPAARAAMWRGAGAARCPTPPPRSTFTTVWTCAPGSSLGRSSW